MVFICKSLNTGGILKNETGRDCVGTQSEGLQRRGCTEGLRPRHMECRHLNG